MIDRLIIKALYLLGDLAFEIGDRGERASLWLWAKARDWRER